MENTNRHFNSTIFAGRMKWLGLGHCQVHPMLRVDKPLNKK